MLNYFAAWPVVNWTASINANVTNLGQKSQSSDMIGNPPEPALTPRRDSNPASPCCSLCCARARSGLNDAVASCFRWELCSVALLLPPAPTPFLRNRFVFLANSQPKRQKSARDSTRGAKLFAICFPSATPERFSLSPSAFSCRGPGARRPARILDRAARAPPSAARSGLVRAAFDAFA